VDHQGAHFGGMVSGGIIIYDPSGTYLLLYSNVGT